MILLKNPHDLLLAAPATKVNPASVFLLCKGSLSCKGPLSFAGRTQWPA
jgi:hypothetical protein